MTYYMYVYICICVVYIIPFSAAYIMNRALHLNLFISTWSLSPSPAQAVRCPPFRAGV